MPNQELFLNGTRLATKLFLFCCWLSWV